MNSTTRRLAALLGAVSIALAATACSKSEPTGASTGSATSSPTTTAPAPKASEIVAKAKANALAATSGAFSGQVEEKGEKMKIDFKGTKDGATSDITLDLSPNGKVRLVTVSDAVYMQGDATFWKSQGAPAELAGAGDKFVKAPAGSADDIAADLTISSFLEEAFTELTPDSIAPEAGEESVNGVDCWVVTDKAGKAEGALYVSKDAMEIVRFTGSTDSPGQLDFSSWNEDLGIKAPAADQVIDVS